MDQNASITTTLRRECIAAQKLTANSAGIRDMVFQCAIFQTSAALEVYLKLLVESWIFALKSNQKWNELPDLPRGYLISSRLKRHFSNYAFTSDETLLLQNIPREYKNFPVFDANAPIPEHLDGKIFHEKTAYPSFKNLKRLFFRVGVENFQHQMDKLLRGDVETLIENFQSVRTAIAHSAPPDLTLADTKKNMDDIHRLVGGIDRIFFRHVVQHGGTVCWA